MFEVTFLNLYILFTLLNNQLTIIPLPVICRIEALILLWMLNAMVLKKVSRTTLSCNVASKNPLITHSKSRQRSVWHIVGGTIPEEESYPRFFHG